MITALHVLLRTLARFGLIAVIDLSLSGDDALVIAMAARDVPPKWRRITVILGAVCSVALQVTFAAVISLILGVPLVHAAGGLLLLWIAWKLVMPQKEEGSREAKVGSSIMHAVRIIVLADISLSLDNVLALVAVSKGNLFFLGGGLLLSACVLLWGAVWLSGLMQRFVWLVYVGGFILLWVAMGMILEDKIIEDVLPPDVISAETPIHIGLVAILGLLAWFYLRLRHTSLEGSGPGAPPPAGA